MTEIRIGMIVITVLSWLLLVLAIMIAIDDIELISWPVLIILSVTSIAGVYGSYVIVDDLGKEDQHPDFQ